MYTYTYDQEQCTDTRLVGGKAASLADMTQRGLPVSPGFAVTAEAYLNYVHQGDTWERLGAVIRPLSKDQDFDAYDEAERQVREIFSEIDLPDEVKKEIADSYEALCRETGVENVAVAVRSSATAEDSVDASFAGEFETWVDIVGAEDVVAHVRKCYESVYSARVLSYLASKNIAVKDIEMAVVVQKTVRARSAGVMFTISPISGDRSKISVDASWGLGLSVVGGEVTPDHWVVDKVTNTVVSHTPGDKRIEYRRGDAPVDVEESRWAEPCLSDEEVLALAQYGLKLEKDHGDAPQDIEFAIDEELPDGSNLVLLQCRPETVWSHKERTPAFDAGGSMMDWITGTITGTTS